MTRVALLAALALALAGCGGGSGTGGTTPQPGEIGPTGDVRVAMQGLDESDITGEVSLSPSQEGGTNVVAELTGSFGVPEQPAAIHRGTCDSFEPQPTWEFGPLVEGFFAGTIEPSFDEVTSGDHVIVVRAGPEAADEPVSCGEVGSAIGG